MDEVKKTAETAADTETSLNAISCCDVLPWTICPALTNGGVIRTMDNHQLAKLAVRISSLAPMTEEQYFKWLEEPSAACMAHNRELGKESG